MHLGPEKFEIVPTESLETSLKRELLGKVQKVADIEEERDVVAKIADKQKIDLLNAAFLREKDRQNSDPINPNSPFANFTRLNVIELLDLPNDEDLKFYTAVSDSNNKTVLERDFSIDAFLELNREKAESIIIPINLTTKIKENSKAIVFDLPKDFPLHGYFKRNKFAGLEPDEEKLFFKYVNSLANEVTRRIKYIIEITENEEKLKSGETNSRTG
ncbi:hypothetical protein A2645_00110 [Candidatus Nomurabacteria bacterium RIFCSPHIGHO2_01_FULL_39_9]|uniref:Uncharacterized protein n=1 Tax=Candidatus Nomurabacteria bacterium RIFCSPHIGHO2_01_FULL_39_9 TaxID=1801735 RepID=A0A1F6UVS3_9BACT|nr:MAG: hypothetical protein A2645_00110 [Candidatus Nomurabacteria bacterium RIFCSPHIGHO2_01_FULL_39_9]